MSRDIATRSNVTAAELKPPALSPRLASALMDILNPHPATMGQAIALPAHTRTEAASAAAKYADLCSPPTMERVVWWMKPINAAVRNPQDDKAFTKWVATAIFPILGHDIPNATLTPATQREAVQTFTFIPSAADVYKLLRSHAAPLLAEKAALERLAAAPTDPDSVKPESQAERDAILLRFRAGMAEVRAEQERDAPPHAPRTATFNGPTGAALAALRANNPLVKAAIAMRDRRKGE